MDRTSLNTAVVTTRFIFIDKQPILSAFLHEEDGMWEFTGTDTCSNDSDYLIVSLEEIIDLDKTILDILQLPIGGNACRTGIGEPWVIRFQSK